MYTVKIDKRGKILIPKKVRESMGIFAGQKMTVKICNNSYGDNIQIIPYIYTCKECGGNIPDGNDYDFCDECKRRKVKIVY